jgi:putative aldouronate transport system substrate-binding protein
VTTTEQYRRREFLRRWAVAAGATVGAGLLAACGGATSTPTTPASSVAPSNSGAPVSSAAPGGSSAPATAVRGTATAGARATAGAVPSPDANGKIPSLGPGVPDVYTKFPSTFKSVNAVPGKGSKIRGLIVAYNAPPIPKGENRWWQELEKRLGITFEPVIQPADGYPQRLATIIAGGDIPELTFLYFEQVPDQYKIIQQGAYADLTQYLSGDGLKEFPNLAQFPDFLWQNARTNNKLYGAPRPLLQIGAQAHWRKDWGEKLGIPSPRNADEFLDLMTKFTNSDPDGNGRPDSYGIHTIAQFAFGVAFFSNMFRAPNQWQQNPDGSLTADIETPQFRQAVEYMKRLHDAKIFHPDTAAGTRTQRKDLITTGKVGFVMDALTGWAGTAGFRAEARKLNSPTANVTTLVPPGFDGKPGNTHLGTGFTGYAAIPAKFAREPEKIREFLRVIDYFAAPFGSEEWVFLNYGIEGVHHTIDNNGARIINDLGRSERANGDLHNLCNPMPAYWYPDPNDAQEAQIAVRDCMAIGIPNPAQGIFSQTNASAAGRLNQLRIDRIGSIVQGREPLSAYDQFVKDWQSGGGDQIRKEFQEGLQTR